MNKQDKNEKIGHGKFVTYTYKLYNDADNNLLFEAPAEAPDMLVYGVSQEVVPGLLAAMEGLGSGDRFEVTLPPQAAFGEHFDENVLSLDKEIFMRDGELAEEVTVGAMLPMMTDEGYRVQGRVVAITDKEVKMDFNHPFAGMTVRFEGEIGEVRDATPEELQPVHGCGGGCGGCGGGCNDGGCGSSAEGDSSCCGGSGSCGCN